MAFECFSKIAAADIGCLEGGGILLSSFGTAVTLPEGKAWFWRFCSMTTGFAQLRCCGRSTRTRNGGKVKVARPSERCCTRKETHVEEEAVPDPDCDFPNNRVASQQIPYIHNPALEFCT